MRCLFVLLFALAACRDDHPAAPTPSPLQRPDLAIGGTIVPQSHEFPAGHAAAIRRMFENNALSYPIAVMSDQGVQTQFVNPKPVFIGERKFVVGLPPASHAALDKLIAGLGTAKPPLGATYELSFWAIDAAPAVETDVARDLGEIAPMLQKLDALGKRRYRAIDRIAARSRDGADTKLTGRMLRVDHKLMAGPDGIELDLVLRVTGAWRSGPPDAAGAADGTDRGPFVETTLHVPLDQPVVIGDAAQASTTDGTTNLLLYVVRARRVD